MSDTANHRVEMHRLAVARRAAGKPIWAETIDLKDIFNQDSMMFEDRRDSIVGQILSLIHISEPTRRHHVSRMPSSA